MKLIKQTKSWLLSLRFLFRPMFVISLILHGWLLNLPLPSASKPESKKPEEIEEKVQITRLIPPSSQPTSKINSTPPKLKSPTTVKPSSSLPKITPKRQQIPQSSPSISLAKPKNNSTPALKNSSLESSLQPPKKQLKPSPKPKTSPSSQATPKPSPSQPLPEAKIDNYAVASNAGSSLLEELRPRILKRLAQSTNDLAAVEKYLDTLPLQFIKDEQISFFLTEQKQLKSPTFGYLTIPQTSPANAYYDYIEPVVKNELGFDIIQLEPDYGDALLYEAKNSSNVVFYMSIVKLKGSGAFLVLWANNPNKPQ